jgi:putrescine aminotransferase
MTQRNTKDWQVLDARHYLHPFTDHKALAERGTHVIADAKGVWLRDADGREILDGMSGLWCVNIGYGRRELIEAACAQLERLPYYNSFFQCTHPPAIELAALLAEVTPPQFRRVFFTTSGSEALDTVVRLVRRYWDLIEQPQRKILISRENAYHGSTLAGASLGGMKAMHAQGDLPVPGIEHVAQPYWFGSDRNLSPDEFGLACARALERKILELGPERVAAFVAEPIQGAGGVVIPPASYWPEVARICRAHGVLLVVDEVICGFGRTGCWFGSEYYGLEPDLMPMAKAMSSAYQPIGGVMVADRVADVLVEQGGEFFHGFTHSAHPVACAVAIANIGLLRRERIIERAAADTMPYLQERWRTLGTHPLVGEARGLGMLAALELVRDKASGARFEPVGHAGTICRDIAYQQGLIMRAVRDTMIVAPPLVMTRAEIDELITRVVRSLDLTAAALARG